MKNTALLGIIGIIIIVGGVVAMAYYSSYPQSGSQPAPMQRPPVAATTSVTTTSTTTMVAHTPPFPAPTPKATSGVRGVVTIGPTCPVQKDPPDPACADKPYQTTLVVSSTIVGRNGGVLVQTDAQGHFTKELTPGTYTIRGTTNGTPPTLAPVTVTVKAGQWTNVNLQFDSGIR